MYASYRLIRLRCKCRTGQLSPMRRHEPLVSRLVGGVDKWDQCDRLSTADRHELSCDALKGWRDGGPAASGAVHGRCGVRQEFLRCKSRRDGCLQL